MQLFEKLLHEMMEYHNLVCRSLALQLQVECGMKKVIVHPRRSHCSSQKKPLFIPEEATVHPEETTVPPGKFALC